MDHIKKPAKHDIPEPNDDLFEKVMARIVRDQRVTAIKKFFLLVLGFGISMSLSIPAWQSFQAEMARSGFLQYLAVVFTNLHAALLFWKDFSLSLLESLPALSGAALLGVVLLALIFLRLIFRYWILAFGNHPFAEQNGADKSWI